MGGNRSTEVKNHTYFFIIIYIFFKCWPHSELFFLIFLSTVHTLYIIQFFLCHQQIVVEFFHCFVTGVDHLIELRTRTSSFHKWVHTLFIMYDVTIITGYAQKQVSQDLERRRDSNPGSPDSNSTALPSEPPYFSIFFFFL